MKRLLQLVCVVCFATTVNAQDVTWLHGEWEGLGFQISTSGTWPMEVSVNMERFAVEVRYPSLECGGAWYIQSSDACTMVFVETLQYGTDRCMDQGMIVMTRVDENHVSFNYFLPGTQTVEAYATLKRMR